MTVAWPDPRLHQYGRTRIKMSAAGNARPGRMTRINAAAGSSNTASAALPVPWTTRNAHTAASASASPKSASSRGRRRTDIHHQLGGGDAPNGRGLPVGLRGGQLLVESSTL